MRSSAIILLALFLGLSVLAGCNSELKAPDSKCDGRDFPKHLAGTWKADASLWQVTLKQDGSIISAVGKSGLYLPVADGRLYQEYPNAGDFGYMEFGPGLVEYDPSTRELKVRIEIAKVFMSDSKKSLEGSITYNFVGSISEEGNVWYAQRWTTGSFGGISLDPNEIVYEPLVLKKVKEH